MKVLFTIKYHNLTPNRFKILANRHDGTGDKLMFDELTKGKADIALRALQNGALLSGAKVSTRNLV